MNDQKTAVISGGLGDIGRAVAVLLGQQGVRVAVSDLLEENEAAPVLGEMRRQGCRDLFYHQADVSSETAVKNWLDTVEAKWGIPQIIVPNAGIVVRGSLVHDDLPAEEVRRQIEVNFWGGYYMAVQAAKKLKAAGMPGRIVFIGSWVAERPDARISSYCISKAALRMLCKTLALELAGDDILVNEVAPGIVAGGLSKKNQQQDPGLLERHMTSIPMHQLVTPEEVAKHVFRLCDFEHMNITGAVLLADGGLSLTSKMTI